MKDVEPEELRRAVRVVAAREALLAPTVTRRLLETFSDSLVGGERGLVHPGQH